MRPFTNGEPGDPRVIPILRSQSRGSKLLARNPIATSASGKLRGVSCLDQTAGCGTARLCTPRSADADNAPGARSETLHRGTPARFRCRGFLAVTICEVPYIAAADSGANIPARCIRRAPRPAMREPARQPPLGGFSLHSVDDGVAYFQHEHDTAGPIPCFNIFVARPGATQFLAAFVDGPIDPSGGLITGYAIAERNGCELCFARTARVPLSAHIWTLLHQNIGTSTACPSATISRFCRHILKTDRRIPERASRRCRGCSPLA